MSERLRHSLKLESNRIICLSDHQVGIRFGHYDPGVITIGPEKGYLAQVHGNLRTIVVGELHELHSSSPDRCDGHRAARTSKKQAWQGVVANFAPKAGTGAGRRVQDMSELEIFG